MWAADPDRSPTTLAVTESRLRLYVRPWFGERPIKRIGPPTFAVGKPTSNKSWTRPSAGPPPEEAGRLLAQFPLFWWDHVLCLLGTGLRFGEPAGLRRRRVHLNRALPVLQVVDTRYQAGRLGSGFKPRPKRDAGIREIPLAPQVVEAIRRRQLPPGTEPSALVFTGPGGGPGSHGGPGVPKGARTVLSRHNFHRTYHAALAKLADPTGELRSTAARALTALRAGGPHSLDRLTAALADRGRAIRPTTVQIALGKLVAAGLAAEVGEDTDRRWLALPAARDPCWRPWTCAGPTTSATPSRPGSRTPASQPGSSTR